MILFVFLIIGLAAGLLRGGGLSGLVGMRLRAVWVLFPAAAAELFLLLAPRFAPGLPEAPGVLPAVQLARFAPLFVFALANAEKWRVWLIGAGFAMNFAAIAANGWRMPVSSDTLPPRYPPAEYTIMQPDERPALWFLSDVIPVVPGKAYASIGDAVLGLGVLLTVQHGMARYSTGKHVRGSLASRASSNAPADAAHPAEPEAMTEAIPEGRTAQSVQPVPQDTVNHRHDRQGIPGQPERAEGAGTQSAPADPGLLPLSGPFPDGSDQRAGLIRLPPRLQAVAELIDRGAAVADIGCDHGKLAAWLALNGAPRVIAVDVSAKSLAKTRRLVRDLGLQHIVQARVGDGLRKFKPGEADVIVMAGLGGPTICSVLDEGRAAVCSALKLVLQPMNAVGAVRRWLVDNGFRVADELLAEEDGRIYQILAAVPGADAFPPMSLFDLEIGHLLIDRRHPLLEKLLESRVNTIDAILSEIADNATPKAEARRSELIELRGRCAEVLEWAAR